jgi:hypothetical protein
MEKIDVYDADTTKFEWNTIWIKKCKGQRKGEEPTRYKATTKEQIMLIGDELNNFMTEELNLFSNQYIRPIFDRDCYDTPIDVKADKKMIRHIFGADAEIKVATRTPRLKNGKQFWSARYIVQDVRIRPNQLLDFIKFEGKIPDDYFDLTKYGKGGQFFTLYNEKKYDGEVPPLLPYNDKNPNPLNYYATYVDEGWKDYDSLWELLQYGLSLKKAKEAPIEYKDDAEDVVMGKSNEITEIISHLNPKRADHYEKWFKFVAGTINYGTILKLKKREIVGLIHDFSRLSVPFYEEDRVDDWITKNYDRMVNSNCDKKLGRNYLINVCLKEDDYIYWEGKYKFDDYKGTLKRFNKECIRVLGNAKWIKINKIDDVNLVPYSLLSKDDLTHRYSVVGEYFYKMLVKDKDGNDEYKTFSIADAKSPFWKDPNVMRYENIIYAPLRPDDGIYYNTWVGWKASTYKVCKDYKKCEIFITHLKDAWCKGDERLCKWFLEYFSGILRGGRSCVCPIIKGKQGSGKDCFISELFMNRIMGADYCITTNNPVSQIFGKFNGALLNKSLGVLEEGGYDLESIYEIMKSIISNDKLTIEEKFKAIICAKNYINLIVSTNKHDILKGDKGMKQRRLLYIECDPVKRSPEYYDEYFKALDDEDALSAFYHYLLDEDMVFQYDIKNLAYLQKTMPDTKVGVDITKRNIPATTKFLRDYYFKADVLKEWIEINPQKAMKIAGRDLQTSYRAYCEFNGFEKIKMEQFTTNLLNYNEIEYKKSNAMYYVVPFNTILTLHKLMLEEEADGKLFIDDAVLYKSLAYSFDGDDE